MAEDVDVQEDKEGAPKKSSKMPMILGLLAVLLGGGGGFYAAWSGLIFGHESPSENMIAENEITDLADVTFVAVDPMTISLGAGSSNKHLRFRAHLEVPSQYQADVEHLLPRVTDVLNGYLRAVETKDLETPSALSRLRAQMLRRVQIVAGAGRVNDLLVMEFVLN